MQTTIDNVVIFRPTREDVANLKVGDLALDAFGKWQPVAGIYARREDIKGRLFVCFYTKFGPDSTMSASYKEGEVVCTVPLTNRFNTVEAAGKLLDA